MPEISKDEIEDQSKGDSLLKLLAVAKVSWQIVQLVARWSQHLASSQLEVVTVAYSFCTFCAYLLFLHKPQGVTTARIINASRHPDLEEMQELASRGPVYLLGFARFSSYEIPGSALHALPGIGWNPATARMEYTDTGDDAMMFLALQKLALYCGSVLCAILFGLLHCIA
jgi:hypothetical protein